MKASNANLHIFKTNRSSPYISEFMGCKSATVSTKDTRDAYDNSIHFISKEKKRWFCQGSTGQTGFSDQSDRSILADIKNNISSFK